MRQDKRFRPGEAITSRTYARLLSSSLDFLVTVDPHLHRWHSLDELFAIRTRVVAAAPAIAGWQRRHLRDRQGGLKAAAPVAICRCCGKRRL